MPPPPRDINSIVSKLELYVLFTDCGSRWRDHQHGSVSAGVQEGIVHHVNDMVSGQQGEITTRHIIPIPICCTVRSYARLEFVHHGGRNFHGCTGKRPGTSWSIRKTTSFLWICTSVHRFLRGGSQATICVAETSTLCSLVCCRFKIRSWRGLGETGTSKICS